MENGIDNAIVSLTEQIKKLQQDNQRLSERDQNEWRTRAEAQDAKEKVRKLEAELEKARRESEQHRRDMLYWRKAVRYEQVLKKRCDNPRHVPTFNSVRRRRDNGEPYFPGWVNAERSFLKHWRKENKRVPGLNGGRGVLELILSEDINGIERELTQRDATVAATVIQWLGTNCGHSFLFEVNREIEQREAARRKKAAPAA